MDLNILFDSGLGLKYLRLLKGVSLRELSKSLGFSHTLIAKHEASQTLISKEIQKKYESVMHIRFEDDLEEDSFLSEMMQKLLNGILYYNDALLKECLSELDAKSEIYENTLFQVSYDVIKCVASIYTNRNTIVNESLWQDILSSLPDHLNYLLIMGLSHKYYLDYRFSEALNLLKLFDHISLKDAYKALVYEKQSDIMFYQFNLYEAMALNDKAYQIFSAENMIVRMSLCEIRNDLFKPGFIHSEQPVDYAGLAGKAIQFKLYFMTDTILFIKGLRALYNDDTQTFIESFRSMEIYYPSSNLYYALGLYLMNDLSKSENTLSQLKEERPPLFKKGYEALKRTINNKALDIKAFKAYLKEALKVKSYHDTLLINKVLQKHYLSKRLYKEAYHLLDTIKDVVLSP